LEGGEGAGKSTQAARLYEALREAGITVRLTREPGGSPGAEAIRTLLLEGAGERWDPVSEACLFAAARRDHVRQLIAPALASGTWVVCDRFVDSTLAYQGYGHRLPLPTIAALNRFAVGDTWPDLTLILDLPVEIGLARAAARGAADRIERRDRGFHQRLRDGFHAIAAAEPQRVALIDAAADPDTVQRAVLETVAQRLGVVFSLAGGASTR
jgi:dTMP kinase